MSKINNIEQLKAEIKRLKELNGTQSVQFRSDVKDLRESVRPSNIASTLFTQFTGVKPDKDHLFKSALTIAMTLLLKRMFNKSGSNMEDNVTGIIERIISKIKSAFSKKEDQSAE